MLKYDDGTPASTPQMAHDVATYLDFLENKQYPDIRLTSYMVATTIILWVGISWFYVKYHDFNLHSCIYYLTLDRHEVYALRDGSGYQKFREKIWRNHKNMWLYRGEFS
jgi:ubiquinol-cytochrome c reductase cytochrome c1 subunit